MKVFLSLVALAVFLFPLPGYPEDTPYRLDEVVVTASRVETPLGEAPANVTVITADDIQSSGAQTLIDVFQREPGVFTQNQLGNPKASNIDIRGYGEAAPQNVLFLVNGRRVNSIDLSGADLAQIPVSAIEKIEVYRGPASVLFGDNAAAGAINIILKTGEGPAEVTAATTMGSYGLFKPELSVSGRKGAFSYLFLGSTVDSTGYRHDNALHEKDLLGNFAFYVSQNLTLRLSTGHHTDTYGQPGALFWSDLRRGIVDRKDSTRNYVSATASTEDSFFDFEPEIKLRDDVVLTIGGSYRNRHISSDFDYGSGNFFSPTGQLQTYGFTPKVVFSRPLWNMKNILILGSDWYKNSTTATSSTSFFGSPSATENDVEKRDFAYYANDRFYPLRDLVIEAGYRMQRSSYDFSNADLLNHVSEAGMSSRYDKEAYRLSANYSFADKISAFASYGKGFRFPATDEFITWGYYDSWSGTFIPTQVNRNLAPQITKELDVGVRWNPWHRLSGTIVWFQGRNRNEIFFNPITYANENYDRTKRQGLESNLSLDVAKGLVLNLSYSYTEASFDGGPFDGNRIPLVPRNKAAAKLSYTVGQWDFNAVSIYTGDRYAISDQSNEHEKLPGYTTFDTSVGYRYKKLTALFTVKNLTDKRYAEIGVFSPFRKDIGLYPAPGRQFFLRLEYKLGG